MKKRRKMIQHNLLKNAVAAYFAAVEIHNKPSIAYRYETSTLLMLNAWELLIKAYIRKAIKHRSIFDKDGKTIGFSKALDYVNQHMNQSKPKHFQPIMENLLILEQYRNNCVHYYQEDMDALIFTILARSSINFVEFVRVHFSKDILESEQLMILPIGFSMPFNPETILSKQSTTYKASNEVRDFVDSIVDATTRLAAAGVKDSIVLGFNVYMDSVKKIDNSDLLVAITKDEETDIKISKDVVIRPTSDKSAQRMYMSDEQFEEAYPLEYKDVQAWCKENIKGFKANSTFNSIMKLIKRDSSLCYHRKLDRRKENAISKCYYSNEALMHILKKYQETIGV